MKSSGKMCFKINLKVTKNQCFTLSLEDTFFEKSPMGGEGGGERGVILTPPPSPAVLGLGNTRIILRFRKAFSNNSSGNKK